LGKGAVRAAREAGGGPSWPEAMKARRRGVGGEVGRGVKVDIGAARPYDDGSLPSGAPGCGRDGTVAAIVPCHRVVRRAGGAMMRASPRRTARKVGGRGSNANRRMWGASGGSNLRGPGRLCRGGHKAAGLIP
jgi:hypothetical protein